MKIKFTTDYTPKDKSGISYKKDQIVDLSRPSAEHFIRRNLAIEILSLKKEDVAPVPSLSIDTKGGKSSKKRGRGQMQ